MIFKYFSGVSSGLNPHSTHTLFITIISSPTFKPTIIATHTKCNIHTYTFRVTARAFFRIFFQHNNHSSGRIRTFVSGFKAQCNYHYTTELLNDVMSRKAHHVNAHKQIHSIIIIKLIITTKKQTCFFILRIPCLSRV